MKKLEKSSLTIDIILRFIVIAAFFGWNLLEGSVFENEYPHAMVNLYQYPIWRILLLVLLFLAADWCPSVAIMIAFTIFFYIMDIEVTMDKWSLVDLKHSTAK
uniref:Uncharacterized protein n=1 Tax=viral metagenome TaxID=1070528 RepID=A0A6C0JZW1_9ZZZZ